MAHFEKVCPNCGYCEEPWGAFDKVNDEVLVCTNCGEIMDLKACYGKHGGFQLHGVGWYEDGYMYVGGKNNTSSIKGKRVKLDGK